MICLSKAHKHVETFQQSRHDNGRWADHARLRCPCGHLLVVAIDDCAACGGAALAAHTVDGEVQCEACGGLYQVEAALPVHCAQAYRESCEEEAHDAGGRRQEPCGACSEVMWRATPYGLVHYCDVNKEALVVVEEGDAGARPVLVRCGACLINDWKEREEMATHEG